MPTPLSPAPLVLLLLFHSSGTAQTTEQSASDLIKYLTYQTNRPVDVAVSCGVFARMDAENRAAAQSLVKLGTSALPDINAALDSIEESGSASKFAPNSGWLLYAYAEIKGRAALPRLRKMRGDPNFGFLYSAVDTAAALSLDITSYISAWRQSIPENSCWGSSPQKTLDRLILASERNDQVKPRGNIAVGYAFDPRSPWSKPPEMQDNFYYPRLEDLELDTVFKDRSGRDCGRRRIRFLNPDFEIDSADIADLRRVISICAASK